MGFEDGFEKAVRVTHPLIDTLDGMRDFMTENMYGERKISPLILSQIQPDFGNVGRLSGSDIATCFIPPIPVRILLLPSSIPCFNQIGSFSEGSDPDDNDDIDGVVRIFQTFKPLLISGIRVDYLVVPCFYPIILSPGPRCC